MTNRSPPSARRSTRHQLDRHRRRLRPGPLRGGGRAGARRACATGLTCSPSASGSGTSNGQIGHSAEGRLDPARVRGQPAAAAGGRRSTCTRFTGPSRTRTSKRDGRRWPKLQEEGKVRWIGVSNFNAQQMERCRRRSRPITSLQPPYSLIRREIEAEILPYCRQHGIGVIAYSPMESGLLTGAMTRERVASMPEDDFRQRAPAFQEPHLTRNLELAELMSKSARGMAVGGRGGDCLDAAASGDYGGDRGDAVGRAGGWRNRRDRIPAQSARGGRDRREAGLVVELKRISLRGCAARPGDDHHGAGSHSRVLSCGRDVLRAGRSEPHDGGALPDPLGDAHLRAGVHVYGGAGRVFPAFARAYAGRSCRASCGREACGWWCWN